jgi:hypothetical protein
MDASFTRLRGRGAYLVSSSYAKGVGVKATTILSERGGRCVLRRPSSWIKAKVRVQVDSGSSERGLDVVPLEWEGGDAFFAFATRAGLSYSLGGGL